MKAHRKLTLEDEEQAEHKRWTDYVKNEPKEKTK